MQDSKLLNKDFSFKMPLTKAYDGDDGFYHIQFGLSTTVKDLQGDEMTENALDEMVNELKKVQITINDGHNHSLKDLIGPTTDAWREGTDMVVDLRVRKKWEEEIKDLLDSGTLLGGSIEGSATKTIVQKTARKIQKEIIDGLILYGGALTDIPAAWNLRGSAKESKNCKHSMCSQIMKSLDKSIGDDSISVINTDGSFESLRADIDEALSAKYADSEGSGMRGCYIEYTFPDKVVVEPWIGDDMYVIPYARDVNTDEITLGDPTPADVQIVTKMIEESKWVVKSIKPDKGGNILTDKNVNIPEGMDETFVEKIKTVGDEGKQFIKGLLGFEDPEPTTVTNEPEPKQGGEPMSKDMISKLDVTKMLDERDSKFEKTLEAKDEKIKSLEERLDTSDEKTVKKTKKELLSKSLELHKKLDKDMTPEQESDLVKEIKADLDTDNGVALVDRDIKTMTKSLEKMPAHETPFTGSVKEKDLGDKYAQKAAEGRAEIEKMGTR